MEPEPGDTAPQWKPAGVTKSNSNASAGARSNDSHDSVTCIGTHPLGSLRVHRAWNPRTLLPTSAEDMKEEEEEDDDDDDGDDGPPPLDPPAVGSRASINTTTSIATSHGGLSRKASQATLTHNLGDGDIVLLLDLPEPFIIGCDSVAVTANRFTGIREIPQGPHFIWATHPAGVSPRSGFWIESSGSNKVHVIQWDKFNEILGESSRAEAWFQMDNLENTYSELAPYRDPTAQSGIEGWGRVSQEADASSMWHQLTGGITKELLRRVVGHCGPEWFLQTGDRVTGSSIMAAEIELDKRLSAPLSQRSELDFTFSQTSRTFSTSIIGSDRTLEASDATTYIINKLGDEPDNAETSLILGELQFAYIVGVLMGNDACIQQWWYMLLKLVLRAFMLPTLRPNLATGLFRTIRAQAYHSKEMVDASIIEQSESRAKELRLALTVYKRRLQESLQGLGSEITPEHRTAENTFAQLEDKIGDLFGWDLRGDYLRQGKVMLEDGEEVDVDMEELQAEDERGEWAPELVELDECGNERGLVSWSD